jgi:hypothetical protein
MKTPLDLTVVANNDRFVPQAVKNPDGSVCPINGFIIKWQVFKQGSKTALITKSTADGSITIVDAGAGLFAFWIRAADTKLLAAGDYIHEAVTVDTEGHPVTLTNNDYRLTAGKLTVRDQYTVQD